MKKPQNSTLINVCIIPSDEVGKEYIKISQSLKSNDTVFVLDGETKFPHMTVYMARFANNQVDNVVEATKKALVGVERFICKHTGYFMTKGRYFEASYEKTVPFVSLHERLIDALKEYRINPMNPFEEGYFTPYTEEQQKNAKETGYDLANELFRPHVTLTRYFEDRVPDKNPETPLIDLSFPLSKICVYLADDNGAVHTKIEECIV